MKNAKYIKILIVLCLSIIIIISCEWQEPLPSILDNRVGTYVDTDGDFELTINEDATELAYIIPYEYTTTDDDDEDVTYTVLTNSTTLFGATDLRLDIAISTSIKITFPVDLYDRLYVYTNYSADTTDYTTCIKQ